MILVRERPAPAGGGSSFRALRAVAAVAAAALFPGVAAMAYEAPRYDVVEKNEAFEIRRYAPYIVAETAVEGDFGDAGRDAFRRLAGYIFGGNDGGARVPMTAPVMQEAKGAKIAMTVPVNMDRQDGRWVMTFMMPSGYTLATLPRPKDPRIAFREIPARTLAVRRFSGTGRETAFREQEAILRGALKDAGIDAAGEPVYARYDPPWTPWFLRRNEVLLEVPGRGGRRARARVAGAGLGAG